MNAAMSRRAMTDDRYRDLVPAELKTLQKRLDAPLDQLGHARMNA
jgi:hypothetical protein